MIFFRVARKAYGIQRNEWADKADELLSEAVNRSQFHIIGLGEENALPQDGILSELPDWYVRAGAMTIRENDGAQPAPENTWFIRRENGWFAVTDWAQVSERYLPLEVFACHGEDSTPFAEHYGTILLEA